MNIEKEIKLLLCKEDYYQILREFEWNKEVVQTNYYYINRNQLLTYWNEPTIRIRDKNGEKWLQVKIDVGNDGNRVLHIKDEYEKKYSSIPDTITNSELSELTNLKFDNDVSLIGNLKTIRKIYDFDEFTQICLDINEYLGVIDYEIEVEYTNEYPAEIEGRLLNANNLQNNCSVGKFSRFMKRRLHIENEDI